MQSQSTADSAAAASAVTPTKPYRLLSGVHVGRRGRQQTFTRANDPDNNVIHLTAKEARSATFAGRVERIVDNAAIEAEAQRKAAAKTTGGGGKKPKL